MNIPHAAAVDDAGKDADFASFSALRSWRCSWRVTAPAALLIMAVTLASLHIVVRPMAGRYASAPATALIACGVGR